MVWDETGRGGAGALSVGVAGLHLCTDFLLSCALPSLATFGPIDTPHLRREREMGGGAERGGAGAGGYLEESSLIRQAKRASRRRLYLSGFLSSRQPLIANAYNSFGCVREHARARQRGGREEVLLKGERDIVCVDTQCSYLIAHHFSLIFSNQVSQRLHSSLHAPCTPPSPLLFVRSAQGYFVPTFHPS